MFNGGGVEEIEPRPVQKKKKAKKRNGKRERYMRPAEEKRIWKELEKYPVMKDLAEVILGTAMRPNNIINLRWEQIDWEQKQAFISVEEHKQGHAGKYLLKKVIPLLKRRQEENGDFPFVFYRLDGAGKPKRIRHRWYQRQWEKIMEDTGIRSEEEARGEEPLRFYDLRHTCLSRVAAKGANEFQLKAISNHGDPNSLKHYIKDGAVRKEAEKFL